MTDNYDRIAALYDVDMARNMRFDDVAFYRRMAAAEPGRVLEAGCGNGRVLLPLAAHGLDVVGIDRSHAMLRALQGKATATGTTARVCRMDLRALGFDAAFSTVLLPYSLITYLVTRDELSAAFAGVRMALRPGGRVIVDAFVPRDTPATGEYALDYRRAFETGTLQRSRRVTPLADGCNRIERRYEILDAREQRVDCIEVEETVRPYAPDALARAVGEAGFVVESCWSDYATPGFAPGAQFATVIARGTSGRN